ncbi:MAG: amidohydrolase [Acidobacteriota bacterium]
MKVARFLLLLALLGSWHGCGPDARAPDLILYNARIVTLDEHSPIVEAVALREGIFTATGTSQEIRRLAGPATREIDVAGSTVIPGLADNHFHSIGGGPGVDLSQARSLDELLQTISQRASETPPGELIVSNSNWHEGQLREQRLPYRADLDRAAPHHPVVLVRGGHEYILNSAALDRWNIDENTPEPPGGRIGRDEQGHLNGELVDGAKALVSLPRLPTPTMEERIEQLAAEHRQLNAAGLTSIRYPGASPAFYQTLQEMKRRGVLTVRVNFLFRVPNTTKPAELEDLLTEWGQPNTGDSWLSVGGAKLGVDGGFEGGWMREPYAEPWGENGRFRGLQTFPTENYKAIVRALNRRGWRVATHAVGDAAIDLVLDAYQEAHREKPITDRRWSIEHGFMARADQLPRMRALGLVVSAQNHLYLAGPVLVKYWGAERAARVTPMRAYLDAGVHVSTGSDSPVVPYSPLWTLYHFITRDTISAGVMGADQRIPRETALRLATLGNAYLTFEEHRKGSIEPGRLADLVVLSRDILRCREEDMESTEVLMTVVGGEVVFRHQQF